MEPCTQCGIRVAQHPVVAIMNEEDVKAHPYAKLEDALEIVEANGSKWAAMPVCAACHQAPRLKSHFHMRNGNWQTGLRLAGSNNIGGAPIIRK